MMHVYIFFFLILRLPPRSPLFPYTTLFRSAMSVAEVIVASPVYVPACPTVPPGVPVHVVPVHAVQPLLAPLWHGQDRKSTRLNSSHVKISYAVFCLKKKKIKKIKTIRNKIN